MLELAESKGPIRWPGVVDTFGTLVAAAAFFDHGSNQLY